MHHHITNIIKRMKGKKKLCASLSGQRRKIRSEEQKKNAGNKNQNRKTHKNVLVFARGRMSQ